MSKSPKMTLHVQMVLAKFLSEPGADVFGAEIIDETGLGSGTLYPILARLEATGWLVGNWEDPAFAGREGRPQRRYYRLTATGEAAARAQMRTGRSEKLQHWLGAVAPQAPGLSP